MPPNDPWYGANPPPETPLELRARRRSRFITAVLFAILVAVVAGVWYLFSTFVAPYLNQTLRKLDDMQAGFSELTVTSPDMEPTLMVGDSVLTLRLHQPGIADTVIERGDIVLVGSGDDERLLRVVGLAGDAVLQLADGTVEVRAPGEAGNPQFHCAGEERDFGGRRQYVVLESDFYLVGDNCGEARDSRDFAVGPVDHDTIVAVAIWRMVPDGLPEVLKDMGTRGAKP